MSMNAQISRRLSGSTPKDPRSKDIIPKNYDLAQLQQFDPMQKRLYGQQEQYLGPQSYLARLAGGEEGIFDEIEAPALRQFQALQGDIASRFSGMGLGGRKSSGFQNATNTATSEFVQDLASKRNELKRQALQDLMGFTDTILGQRPVDRSLVEKQQKQPKQSGWNAFASGLGGAIPGAITGFATGGPVGAVAGGAAGAYKGYNSQY